MGLRLPEGLHIHPIYDQWFHTNSYFRFIVTLYNAQNEKSIFQNEKSK